MRIFNISMDFAIFTKKNSTFALAKCKEQPIKAIWNLKNSLVSFTFWKC